MGGQQVSSSVSFDALPPLVVEHIASFMMLSPYVNDVAANLRVVCKAWRRALQRVEHRTVHLASPCHSPAFSTLCAGPFGQAALGAMTLVRRRQLLALVARSGNLENLQIAVAAAGCAPDDTAATAAAASGHLEVCRWLLASRPGPLQPQVLKDMMQAAAEHGHEAVMRWLADAAGGHAGTAQLVCPSVLAAAVRGGQSQLVDQLVSEVRHAAPAPQRASRMRGHPVRSVRERSLYERLMAAAKYRPAAELEALWAAEAAGAELTQLQLLSAAAGSGLPDYQRKIDFLERVGCEWHVGCLQAAIAEGDEDIATARLAWLRARGGYTRSVGEFVDGPLPQPQQQQAGPGVGNNLASVYDKLCGAAARAGHVRLLRSLVAEATAAGVDASQPLERVAFELIQLDKAEEDLQYQIAHYDVAGPWDMWELDPATGELRRREEEEVANQLHNDAAEEGDEKEEWDYTELHDDDVWAAVAEQRLRQRLSRTDFFFGVMNAARQNKLGVLQAVLEARPTWLGLSCALRAAAAAGQVHVVQWGLRTSQGAALLAQQPRWGWRLLVNAAGSGCVPLMSLLREHGCAWDATAFVAAVKSGSEEAVLWLRENGCPLPRSDMPCWRAAIANCDVRMLRLLRQRLGRACRGLLPCREGAITNPGQGWLGEQSVFVQQLAEAWYRQGGGGEAGAGGSGSSEAAAGATAAAVAVDAAVAAAANHVQLEVRVLSLLLRGV